MKKFSAILVLVLIAGTSFLSIAKENPGNETNTNAKATQILTKQIEYPAFAKEQKIQGDVYVSFTVNKDGRIENIQANANNEVLKNYVISKLSTSNVAELNNEAGQTIYVKFSFRLY
ncbi:MAG: TonB family protein [Sphingobacteriales bacterium]|nr:TonB family protein [Sphingobacteriales bacterium]